ncbi:S1 family peptidase [Roseisolibacter agri]|uniref:Uncharacterized protein n=1 Tax=Roseisolibacter agri TaxID=2014610 RepID=A0AA37QDU8_9BACT|nr:serine protease [Roseisolibacter agri]GLC23933.1 hypothetical protein rosag_04460 [Roseisolibacter agri]
MHPFPRFAHAARALARCAVLAALALTPLAPRVAAAQEGAAAEVFRRFSDRVIKVQVIETGSAAKARIGSGFFATADGHVVTNYHVVSDLILAPERYRAEIVDARGTVTPVRVLGVDVVHDLAVIGAAVRPAAWFPIAESKAVQGDRLYALGHPEDLGLSIVEGTYNGLLQHTLYPRLHFTGSLNSGMSGGPTIAADGRVIGVNVSTAGNQLSFLVPVERAVALLRGVLAPGATPPARTLADVGRQLRDYQELYLRDMFAGPTKTVDLGPYRLVTQPAPFFRCWADATRRPQRPYEQVQHRCSTDDYVFISGDQTSGVVSLRHDLITTTTLNPVRFYALYGTVFGRDDTPGGEEEHVTSWKCGTRNVRQAETRMRAVLCLRRYRKLGALYDGVLKVAVLGRGDTGLVSTLTMTGVTFENVERVSRRYLERVSWK